jgi:hypothetical protein
MPELRGGRLKIKINTTQCIIGLTVAVIGLGIMIFVQAMDIKELENRASSHETVLVDLIDTADAQNKVLEALIAVPVRTPSPDDICSPRDRAYRRCD